MLGEKLAGKKNGMWGGGGKAIGLSVVRQLKIDLES